jgi:hypothetical protein
VLFPTEALAHDHREMEAALDCLAGSLASASLDIEAFRRAHRLCIRHYTREEAFLIRLGALDAALAAKLRGQHEEALELAARLEEALAARVVGALAAIAIVSYRITSAGLSGGRLPIPPADSEEALRSWTQRHVQAHRNQTSTVHLSGIGVSRAEPVSNDRFLF